MAEKRVHRAGARHIWKDEASLSPRAIRTQREMGMWMRRHDMTWGQAWRDPARKVAWDELRYWEGRIRRNERLGLPWSFGIDLAPGGSYDLALRHVGYRPRQRPRPGERFGQFPDWNIGESPKFVYEDAMERYDLAELR